MLNREYGNQSAVFQKFKEVTEDYEMGVNDHVILIGTTAGNVALTLPPVAEAIGNIYTIYAPTIFTDGNVVTVQDNNESVDWTDLTIDANGDGVVLLSDGRKYWALANEIA